MYQMSEKERTNFYDLTIVVTKSSTLCVQIQWKNLMHKFNILQQYHAYALSCIATK